MGLLIKLDGENERSELQNRINAELREKSYRTTEIEDVSPPDLVEDSEYAKNLHSPSTDWIYIAALVIAAGLLLWAFTTWK